jgi:hypothetical protein
LLIGDFFQLPLVKARPLYTPRSELRGLYNALNIAGANYYAAFDRSVFLHTI